MSFTAGKVIETANKEIGYLEKRSHKLLNSKTKNAGSANFTKYGHETGLGCGVYWCAEFVCWVFMKAAESKEAARKAMCGSFSAACETIRQAFRAKGRYDHNPKPGDLVFFSGTRHGGANHIGIVVDVHSVYVYTVEGNTSGGSSVIDNGGGVASKRYRRDYKRILGYGHPIYQEEKKKPEKSKKKSKTGKVTAEALNVRTGPSAKHALCSSFGPLKRGETVKIISDYGNGWLFIETEKGRRGYCNGQFIQR